MDIAVALKKYRVRGYCVVVLYNEHRPHQGIENKIPVEFHMTNKWKSSRVHMSLLARNIVRKEFLGGLLKSYQRAA